MGYTSYMNLEELKDHIQRDAVMDSTELANEALRTPTLHGKYLSLHADARLLVAKYGNDLAILRLQRWKIYSGKASREELDVWKEEPFQHVLLKTDVDRYMDADPELITLKNKVAVQETKMKMIEEFLKVLNNRNFAIKSAIDWMKLTSGVV